MIVLLAVVLVLMFAASRPQLWVHLVPSLDSKPPAKAAANAPASQVEIAPATPTNTAAPDQQTDHPQTDQTRLRLIGLIILAVLYFGWRFARMGRALRQHRPPKRVGPGISSPTPTQPDDDTAPDGTASDGTALERN
jgi:hypothetical protein